MEGITGLQAEDFLHARRLGFAVKLLAVAQRIAGEGLQLRVHPALVRRDSLLGRVDGRMNGIMVKGNAAGVTMYYGAGAGSRETASAVVADLVDLARALRAGGRGVHVPPLGFHEGEVTPPQVGSLEGVRMRNYLRLLLAEAKAGPQVIDVLARHGVHAEKGEQTRNTLVVLTREATESRVAQAMRELEGIVLPGPVRLRVEELG